MQKIIAAAAATALAATMALSFVAPASAAPMGYSGNQRDRVVSQYCDRNPRDSDCRTYRQGHWSSNDYNRFYGRHRTGLDSLAKGIFGFAFGAIINGAINSGNGNNASTNSHVTRCEARFHSYSARSDTYLGNDGRRHACTL